MLKGEVESAQTRENWELMLRLRLFPAFGDVFVDAISKSDVEAWVGEEAKKVREPVDLGHWEFYAASQWSVDRGAATGTLPSFF